MKAEKGEDLCSGIPTDLMCSAVRGRHYSTMWWVRDDDSVRSVPEVSHRHKVLVLFMSSLTSPGCMCCHPLKLCKNFSCQHFKWKEHRSLSLDVMDAVEPEIKKKIKDGGWVHETCSKRKIQGTGFGNSRDLGDNQITAANADYATE